MTNQDIRGTVSDIDGNPVQGVSVYLINENNTNNVISTTTDSSGKYIFESHPDAQTASDTYHVAAGGSDENNVIVNATSDPNIVADLRGTIDATGGTTVTDTIINNKEYRIHAFENTGSDVFTVNFAPDNATIDALIVAGGGGGAIYNASGGGAGDVVELMNQNISEQNYNIVVGAGGEDAPRNPGTGNAKDNETDTTSDDQYNGDDSYISDIGPTAIGGGSGAGDDYNGGDGGSGGGASDFIDAIPGSAIGNGYGNRGGSVGNEDDDSENGGGGGGGAETRAPDYTESGFRNGGDGKYFGDKYTNTFGENGYFGGGGGGAHKSTGTHGTGGIGGGGNGGDTGTDGQSNTGGGGGGADSENTGDGGSGGSGIVLIRYEI